MGTFLNLSIISILPVQRLPSISLLLNDLVKHTRRADPGHPDCDELERALAKIKEVGALHAARCTLYTAHHTPHTAHCTLHTARSSLHTEHRTPHTAHCR